MGSAPIPVRPGSALRVLLLALVTASVVRIDLYDDGFEIGGGPDDASLVFVRGSFTAEQVGALLGVPAETVDDQRTAPHSDRPGDDPHYTRHGLTVIGEATAWRYRVEVEEGDLSDHFWPAALGVEVMVCRWSDGVYVSVEDNAIEPAHGPLLVEVNNGGAVQYGEDHRPE